MARVTYSIAASVPPNRTGATKPIRVPAGQDTALNLTLVDAAGAAVNLTGCAILLNVRKNSDTGDIVIAREADISDPASDGEATISIVYADTIELSPAARYLY